MKDVFSLYINGINLDEWITEPIDELRLRAEGESIWDFWLDNITVELDSAVLSVLGVDLLNFEDIKDMSCEIRWYGQIRFRGFVEDVRLDPKIGTESIELDLVSIGWKLCKTPVTQWCIVDEGEFLGVMRNSFQTENTAEGDTISEIVARALKHAISYLKNVNGINLSPAPSISVTDDIDFIEYRNNYFSLTNYPSSAKGFYTDNVDYYVATDTKPIKLFLILKNSIIFKKELSDKCYFEDDAIYETVTNVGRNKLYQRVNYQYPDDTIEQLKKFFADNLNLSENIEINIKGSVRAFDYIGYFMISTGGIVAMVRIEVSTVDRFRYKYDDATFGDVLKDLAKMSDSIAWISHEPVIYLKDRENVETLPVIDEDNIETLMVETKSQSDRQFNIPVAYQVLNQDPYNVENDVVGHYNAILNGEFKTYNPTVFKDTLADQGRINLKKLLLRINGRLIDAGQVKEVTFLEDRIKLKTEKRL